jgi:8-oxo-dGTP pyrophosphatase MutT (NUDIX family)
MYVLLGYRQPAKYFSCIWHFPGGGWEPQDESYQDCAVRECFEETDLDLYLKEYHAELMDDSLETKIPIPHYDWHRITVFLPPTGQPVEEAYPVSAQQPGNANSVIWVPVDNLKTEFGEVKLPLLLLKLRDKDP